MIVECSYVFGAFFEYRVLWLVIALVVTLHYWYRNPKYFPPRPKSWPIVGNAFSLPSQVSLYRWCMEEAKKHGPVLRVTMGICDSVVLNDSRSIHEALVEKGWQFSGRPSNAVFESISGNFSNVSFSDPDQPTWKLCRKMLITSLKNFTTGPAYEKRVTESLEKLISIFEEKATSGEAFDPAYSLKLFVYNNMANMCYGKSFDFKDHVFLQLHDANQEFAEAMGKVYSTDIIPLLKRLPFDMPDIAKLKQLMANPINDFIEANFKEHLDYPSDDPSDLTYHLLNLRKESDEPLMKEITDTNIQEIASEIFNAGTDTSRGTLQWLFLCLSGRPDVQNRIHDEIMEVIGHERQRLAGRSVFSARSRMNYTEAVLMECLRFGTVAPMGLPRKTLEDCRLGDYDILKGTQIYINQYAVNHDPTIFKDPYCFEPERFLTPDGLEKSPQLSFGLGRRSCPGEVSAKCTIWFILITLVKRFHFLPGDNCQISDDMYVDNFFDGSPKPFLIKVERRNSEQ